MTDITRRALVSDSAVGPTVAALQASAMAAGQPTKIYQTSAAIAATAPEVDPVRPLRGKVAFITGGARGIGRACGVELARLGTDVALFDIAQARGVAGITEYPLATADDLDEAARLVRAGGVRALAITGDVRRPAQLQRAAQRSVAELGGLDILVVNAGVHHFGDSIDRLDLAAAQAMIDVNIYGAIHTVKAAMPALRRRPGARIIFITSIGGRAGMDRAMAYQATKWAQQGLVKALALDLGESGITVNAVSPGTIDTPLHNKEKPIEQVAREDLASSELPVSIMAPEDIARAVGFLAGPGGTWMSGATIDVDAGRVAKNNA